MKSIRNTIYFCIGLVSAICIGAYASYPGGVPLLKANNLSDVASASTSRTNLGLGTAATQNTSAFLSSSVQGVLNINGGTLPSPLTGTAIQAASANSSNTGIQLNSFAGSSSLNLFRASGTSASPTAVSNGSAIGMLSAYGYGASGYSAAGRTQIVFRATETWTDSSQGSRIDFYTTPTSSSLTSQSAYILPGGLQIGSTTGAVSSSTAGAALGMSKMTASGVAPGAANGLRIEAVCGTNAGTMKLIAYAGTSTTPTTIVDNIGGGNSGC